MPKMPRDWTPEKSGKKADKETDTGAKSKHSPKKTQKKKSRGK